MSSNRRPMHDDEGCSAYHGVAEATGFAVSSDRPSSEPSRHLLRSKGFCFIEGYFSCDTLPRLLNPGNSLARERSPFFSGRQSGPPTAQSDDSRQSSSGSNFLKHQELREMDGFITKPIESIGQTAGQVLVRKHCVEIMQHDLIGSVLGRRPESEHDEPAGRRGPVSAASAGAWASGGAVRSSPARRERPRSFGRASRAAT